MDLVSLFPLPEEVPARLIIEPVQQRRYLSGGELVNWNGPFEEVLSPVRFRSGSTLSRNFIGSYPSLGEKESMEILNASTAAYGNGRGVWPTLTADERIRSVEVFTAKMGEKRETISKLLMWETGKSLNDSLREFDRTTANIAGVIANLKKMVQKYSRMIISEGIAAQIGRSPLGIVLCMGPYNYPLNETFAALIPALAMGNCVILKPPRFGILLYEPLLELFRKFFPPGAINTIYGDGNRVIAPLMKSGKIDALAFIGTHAVAETLKQLHPKPHRLRCVMGLGAKNAAIILPDADLDLSVKETVLGSLAFNGQRCTALKILFVHKSIAGAFIERFCGALKHLVIGMPWTDNVTITPLPELEKAGYLEGLVKDALDRGASIVNEYGGTNCESLYYPAVLYPVRETMRVYSEEQFGPVIPIVPYEDIETPLRFVIDSDFGQQVSIFGRDGDSIGSIIDPLINQVCRININCKCQRGPDALPFTGRKDSAEGTLSISEALQAFSIQTLVAVRDTDLNRSIIRNIKKNRRSNFLNNDNTG